MLICTCPYYFLLRILKLSEQCLSLQEVVCIKTEGSNKTYYSRYSRLCFDFCKCNLMTLLVLRRFYTNSICVLHLEFSLEHALPEQGGSPHLQSTCCQRGFHGVYLPHFSKSSQGQKRWKLPWTLVSDIHVMYEFKKYKFYAWFLHHLLTCLTEESSDDGQLGILFVAYDEK